MLDLSKYDGVIYDDANYNCLHFAVDVYRDLTGCDMGVFVGELLTGRDKRRVNPAALKNFEQLDAPIDPCLALMHGVELHAGIYHQGQIIHFNESGAQVQPPHIAELRHGRIKYYAV